MYYHLRAPPAQRAHCAYRAVPCRPVACRRSAHRSSIRKILFGQRLFLNSRTHGNNEFFLFLAAVYLLLLLCYSFNLLYCNESFNDIVGCVGVGVQCDVAEQSSQAVLCTILEGVPTVANCIKVVLITSNNHHRTAVYTAQCAISKEHSVRSGVRSG